MTFQNKTIGVFSHVDGGKTTLMEAILYKNHIIEQVGNVNKGTTVLDNEPIERRRKITFSSKPVSFKSHDQPYTFIDTPGHMDLTFEMERILQVVDIAILIVSATDGITGYTETISELCEQYQVPVLLFVNKTDVETVDIPALKQEISRFSAQTLPFDHTSLNPDHQFLEDWAMLDDDWLELMLQSKKVSQTKQHQLLSSAIKQRKIMPTIYGSAVTFAGVSDLLMLLDIIELDELNQDNPIAQIYKISHDKNNLTQVHAKIISGQFHSKEKVTLAQSENNLKINEIFYPEGRKLTKTTTAKTGDIVVMTGLTEGSPGEFMGGTGVNQTDLPKPISLTREPVYEVQVIAKDTSQFDEMISHFYLLADEDPMLHLRYKKDLNELYISIVGTIQMDYLKETFLERFNIAIDFLSPSVLYKETITEPVIGFGHFEPLRHYSEVALKLEPGQPGQGIIVKNNCSREELDINFQSRIMTHLTEKTHLGVLTGSPITDLTITLLSGRAHYPETKGGDFREATYRAIRQGLMKIRATNHLLEPWFALKITVPSDLIGKVSADITRMGGELDPTTEISADSTLIEGAVPVSNFTDYPLTFASFTKNKGRLTTQLKGYFPAQNQTELINTINYDPESDLENTANSIFFKKGKGYDAHWSDVDDLRHIQL
ncbi:translation factor GTPase family protein [Holzapfeliella sp. He02]|uniref:Translation factor GTPase family protein n=1 Tax=Holzapfeliella saturejae TaxID=3082953 RepID=A0ABU8SEU3_9LACO